MEKEEAPKTYETPWMHHGWVCCEGEGKPYTDDWPTCERCKEWARDTPEGQSWQRFQDCLHENLDWESAWSPPPEVGWVQVPCLDCGWRVRLDSTDVLTRAKEAG
jgi:hypothetical protein